MKHSITTFLFLFLVHASAAQQAHLAYIYATDSSWGSSVASLLASHGFTTTLIPLGDVASTNFAGYRLVIVDSRTISSHQWEDSASVAAIVHSGKPVLGLGFGGARLFQQMGLSMNWDNAWIDDDTNSTFISNIGLYCVNPSMSIFHIPTPITVPPDSIIQLYVRSGHIGEFGPVLDTSVVMIGREPADVQHYSLTSEQGHYLWGFTNPPYTMTQDGMDLFCNIIVAMVNSSTGIEDHRSHQELPQAISLSQNYPNPFNPATTISFSLPSPSVVSLKVFDALGREESILISRELSAGTYLQQWNAGGLASGIYFYRLQAGSFMETKKLILLR